MHCNNALMLCDVRSSVNTKREGYPAKEWVIRPFYLPEEFTRCIITITIHAIS